MLKIDEAVKAEIETVTGRPVPAPQSRRFEAFFESLTHDHPDLARKLKDALEVTASYPDEEAQRAARRRARIDGLLRRMFTKEVWGQRVLDRRRISFLVFFVVFGVVAAGWSVTLLRGRAGQTVQSAAAPVVAEEVQPVPVEMEVDLEPALVAQVASPPPPRNAEGGGSILPPRELPPYPGSVPPAPTDTYVPPSGHSADASPAAMIASLPLGEVRVAEVAALAFSEEIAEPIDEHLELPPPLAAASPVSALAESSGGNERELAPAFAVNETTSRRWRARAPATATRLSTASRAPAAFLEPPVTDQTSSEFSAEMAANGSAQQLPAEFSDSSSTPPVAASDSPPEQSSISPPLALFTFSSDESVPDVLQPGALIEATLVRDVVVGEEESRQVIADSTGAWCDQPTCPHLRWIGTATISESGRLDVRFDDVYVDGTPLNTEGVAFGADGSEGLPAHLADVTPALLADLFRAGAGGTTDYFDAAARRRTVTIGDGIIATETELPGLVDFVLGRAAGVMRLPEGQISVVRIAAVEAGTSLEVLLLEIRE